MIVCFYAANVRIFLTTKDEKHGIFPKYAPIYRKIVFLSAKWW